MRRVSSGFRRGLGAIALATFAAASSAQAAELTPTEVANKQVVLDFYAALNKGNAEGSQKQTIKATAEKYLSPNYTQHSPNLKNLPGTGTDRDKLIQMFQSRPARPANAPPVAPQKVEAIMAEGDLVMFLTSRTGPEPGAQPNYVFNMFSVKDGKLVDHWDVGGAPAPSGPVGAPLSAPR
jgi:predicted SnoaL-like aldol condensation-catalyzing enzyme